MSGWDEDEVEAAEDAYQIRIDKLRAALNEIKQCSSEMLASTSRYRVLIKDCLRIANKALDEDGA